MARAVALIAMMAAHSFSTLDEAGAPTTATVITAGRAAAAFVVIAGVSLAFMSGGRRVVQGRERSAVSVSLVVRALLIGLIGLALGMLADLNGIDGILPFYAVLFLLAIPLIGLPPRLLAGLAAAVVIAGPVLLIATANTALADTGADGDPSLVSLVGDPLGLVVQLFFTGEYPVVVYMAYICAGLAIGRLDLGSRRVAWWLFGGGTALAVVAQLASALLLYPLGGLAALVSAETSGAAPAGAVSQLLWDPDGVVASWWYLAVPAPHSHSPVDLVHTLGSAVAVLGVALLLTRLRAPARVLSPVAATGAMVLTLYSAHLVFLATGVLEAQPGLRFLAMVVGALAFAATWRRWAGQGPLERIVAAAAGATRRCVADRLARRSAPATGDGPAAERRGGAPGRRAAAGVAHLLAPVVCAAALVLAFWAGARFGPEQEDLEQEDLASADGGEPVPSPVAAPAGPPAPASGDGDPSGPQADAAGPPGPPVAPAGTPDLGRYCLLAEQIDDLEDQFAEDPRAIVAAAGAQLADMERVAPAEIRDAVAISVADYRAEGGEHGARAPDDATLTRAEDTIDTYEEHRCP